MRHQVPHRDVAAPALKLGQVRRHRIVDAQLALLEQQHERGRGGHHFGKRRDVEDGIDGHSLARRNQRAASVRLAMHDFAFVPHQ